MSRKRIALALVVAILAAAGLAWVFRIEILLQLVELRAARTTPVGPNVPVSWQQGPESPAAAPGDRPPNIVLILADDLGWNDLTFGGGGVAEGTVPTPAIDSIAHDGVRFTAGYAANGTCAPSRASIMTGRYATRFGFEFTPTPPGMSRLVPLISSDIPGRLRHPEPNPEADAELPFEAMGMPASELTLAELLGEEGYHTVHIGKWHLGRIDGMAPQEQGFDESLLMRSGLYLPEDHPEVVNSKLDFDPIDRFLWRALRFAASFNGGEVFEPAGYLTDYYTDEAIRVIEANRHRPFFLYLAHWAPHAPLQATREDYEALSHIGDHRLRVYAAMIRALDRGVGRVLDALRERGLEQNTLVIFTSDNGAPDTIGLPRVNDPFRGWKITFFEGGIHVPYFMKWPARLEAGQSFDAPVHGFDLFSTAAAAAGAPLPGDRVIDGVNLLPYLDDPGLGAPHEALFWRSGHYRVVRAGGWKLQLNGNGPERVWLFDLTNDPTERVDLAEQEPERVAALRRVLARHEAEQAPPLWPSALDAPVSVDKTLAEPEAPDDEFVYWPN